MGGTSEGRSEGQRGEGPSCYTNWDEYFQFTETPLEEAEKELIDELPENFTVCPMCDKIFGKMHPSAIYCSNACKQAAYRAEVADKKALLHERASVAVTAGLLQTFDYLLREYACYYCGMIADTVDHTIPQELLKRSTSLDSEIDISILTGIKKDKVMACRECNSTLGKRIFRTLAERRAYIKQRLKIRYKKYLERVVYSDEELERYIEKQEFGEEMAAFIRKNNAMAIVVRWRIRWPNL